MKKLVVLILSVFMLFGCVTKKNHEVIEIGRTEFDGMKITFYEDTTEYTSGESSILASYLYYSTDENKLQYPTAAPYLVSKDKTTKFHVDLYGYNEIYDEEDNVISYTEEIKDDKKVIHIYHLDNNKKYFEKNKNSSDYTILGCISSSTCSIVILWCSSKGSASSAGNVMPQHDISVSPIA